MSEEVITVKDDGRRVCITCTMPTGSGSQSSTLRIERSRKVLADLAEQLLELADKLPGEKDHVVRVRMGGIVPVAERPIDEFSFLTSHEAAAFREGLGADDGWEDYEILEDDENPDS